MYTVPVLSSDNITISVSCDVKSEHWWGSKHTKKEQISNITPFLVGFFIPKFLIQKLIEQYVPIDS